VWRILVDRASRARLLDPSKQLELAPQAADVGGRDGAFERHLLPAGPVRAELLIPEILLRSLHGRQGLLLRGEALRELVVDLAEAEERLLADALDDLVAPRRVRCRHGVVAAVEVGQGVHLPVGDELAVAGQPDDDHVVRRVFLGHFHGIVGRGRFRW
jgi:hypothetical protein